MKKQLIELIRGSIFRKLLFSYLATVLVGLTIVGLVLSMFTRNYLNDAKQEELMLQGRNVNAAIQELPAESEQLLESLAFFDQSYDTRIWLFDRTGKIVATSTQEEVFLGTSIESYVVEEVLQGKTMSENVNIKGLDKPMLSLAIPWGKEDEIYGGILLLDPVGGLNATIGRMREFILWATLFAVIMAIGIVSALSWSIARPIQKIEKIASEIGHGQYRERVEVASEDEVGELARAINQMAGRLEQTEEERGKMEELRSEFMSNISHELRTPLTAMQGFLEALQDGLAEGEAAQRYYRIMYQETLYMNRLVDDLTDLNKLQARQISLQEWPVDLNEVLRQVYDSLQPEAEQKGLHLQLSLAESLPYMTGDPDRLIQIFANLVKNAIKFTKEGEVAIHSTFQDDQIQVNVTDTGIGIGKNDLPRIWERFFKVDRVRSNQYKGTGLGLAIVKELVAWHHGTIHVDSIQGKGTTFAVRFPATFQSQAASQEQQVAASETVTNF